MTKAYVDGILDFKYKNPYSRARESYILSYLEREEMKQVVANKTITDMLFTILVPKDEHLQKANASAKQLLQLALPYLVQADKINKVAAMDPTALKAIRDRLVKAKRE